MADGIEAGLASLADAPDLGQILSEPFGRPIYRFSFKALDDEGDTVTHYVQTAYSVDEAEKVVTVLDFGSIPF